MVELDHSFSTGKDTEYNWEAILDRLIRCCDDAISALYYQRPGFRIVQIEHGDAL